jgi:tRNA threonylcarbamoyladenosine biosynthesis protein TsaB
MLLAIDTSTNHIGLALHDGFQLRVEHSWEAPRRHTVDLVPRIAGALEMLDIGPEHLIGVAVARGPGSFTGLRAGMAVAKGLVMARGLPLVGVPTLDITAAAQWPDDRQLIAVLQAGRGRICFSPYRWAGTKWAAEDEPRLTTWPKLMADLDEATLFCGEVDPRGAAALASAGEMAVLLPGAARLRRAGYLAELAWVRIHRRETDDPATLTPVYLKHPS